MQFNSIEFLFFFLPLFLVIYRIFPEGKRHFPLTVGSVGFYLLSCGGNYWWLAVLCICVVITYSGGILLNRRPGKGALAVFLLVLGGILIFFKVYQEGNCLPAGMSFYLFQMAAYLISVFRGQISAVSGFWDFTSQIIMFPKLLSGPLMDPQSLQKQSRFCTGSREWTYRGMQLFILGLALKVLVANRIGGLWSQLTVLGHGNVSTPFAWMVLVAYTMKLYFDFWGYSLMAKGLGRMLGYELPDNFIDPYASRTVSEFYRRWHATLGLWFRNYLYIPLGGNRKGTFRTIFNLAVVWLFTGLWHGIGGNYLIWAGFLFLLIVNERLWLGKLMQRSHLISHIYVIFVILVSWVPFAIGDWSQMMAFLGRLFAFRGEALNAMDYLVWGQKYIGLFIAGVILATPLPRKICKRIQGTLLGDFLLVVLFWMSVYYISTSAQDPFMYFQY